jgi:CheY-like chemotaxis protein
MPYGKVLIVDDIETNIYVASGLLEPYGLQIESVTSGQMAIDAIKSGKTYDIIFMDHMMPGMDGIEAAALIRKAGYQEPIVVLTANAIVGNEELFLANGFDAYISKPIALRQLADVLHKFVRDRHPKEAAAYTNQLHDIPLLSSAVDPVLTHLFLQDASRSISELEAAAQNGDLHKLQIHAHAMKSALTNIKCSELAATAKALEEAAKSGDIEEIPSQTEAFLMKLRQMISTLQEAEAAKLSEEAELPVNPDILRSIAAAAAEYDVNTILTQLQSFSGSLHDEIQGYLLESDFEAIEKCTQEKK